MTVVAAFLTALLEPAITGVAAKYLVRFFTSSRPARFGALCNALGFSLGRYSSSGPLDGRAMDAPVPRSARLSL